MERNSKRIIPARIRQARESRGYTTSELAELIDVSKQTISQYEMGKITPSNRAMLQLSTALEYPIVFFEKEYPHSIMSSGPVFFRSRKTTKVKAKKAAIAKISIFKEIADYFEQYLDFPPVNLPEVDYLDNRKDLTLEQIEQYAMVLRKCWGLGDGPIPNLMNVVQKNGIMVSEMRLGYSKIDAFSVFKDGRPYIFLSGDKESNAKMRFSIAHELGHLVMHSDIVSDEELDKKVIDEKLEYEANKFAAAFLLPSKSFSGEVTSSSIDYFIRLKGKWLSSIASMIYRCDDLGLLSENQIRYLKSQMTSRRYWKCEPLDEKIQIETPFLFKQAVDLLLNNLIVTKSEIVNSIGCRAEEIELYCYLKSGTLLEKEPGNIIKFKTS